MGSNRALGREGGMDGRMRGREGDTVSDSNNHRHDRHPAGGRNDCWKLLN